MWGYEIFAGTTWCPDSSKIWNLAGHRVPRGAFEQREFQRARRHAAHDQGGAGHSLRVRRAVNAGPPPTTRSGSSRTMILAWPRRSRCRLGVINVYCDRPGVNTRRLSFATRSSHSLNLRYLIESRRPLDDAGAELLSDVHVPRWRSWGRRVAEVQACFAYCVRAATSAAFLLHGTLPRIHVRPRTDYCARHRSRMASTVCFATACDGVGVIEFKRLRAGHRCGIVHERALAAVALPDRALHVPAHAGDSLTASGRRRPSPCRFLSFELGDAQAQRRMGTSATSPGGDLMPQQGLRLFQVVQRFLPDRDLKPVCSARGRGATRARGVSTGPEATCDDTG